MTTRWQARAATPADFSHWLRFASAQAVDRWPQPLRLLPADMIWQTAGQSPGEDLRLYVAAGDLVGYAWLQGDDALLLDADAQTLSEAWLLDVLDWAKDRRRLRPPGYPFYLDVQSMAEWADWLRAPLPHPRSESRFLFVSAFDEESLKDWLHAQGFEALTHYEPHLRCDRLASTGASGRFNARPVRFDEFDLRIETHRAAWAPSTGFSQARYDAVRAQPRFDPNLDLLCLDEDGAAVGCATAWADAASGVGMIEPFGIRPEWRGTGASQALLGALLAVLADRGMRSARLYTACFNDAARSLNARQGFVEVARARTHCLRCD